jgi:hypothetical protein
MELLMPLSLSKKLKTLVRLLTACWTMGLTGVAINHAAPQENVSTRSSNFPENMINVSWGDQILVGFSDAKLDTPEKIVRSVNTWKSDSDSRMILWRGSSYYIQRYYDNRTSSFPAYYKKIDEVTSKFDPVQTARNAAHKTDQLFLMYMTIFDHGAPVSCLYGGKPFPWQDRFTIQHPQFQVVDREGHYQYGVLEMACPESRQLMVDRIKTFVEEFKTDGVYVCPRSHSAPADHADQFGFSAPIVKEYQKRYGINILKDPRFDYKSSHFNSHDPAVEKWRNLRGEYLVQFYRDLRKALPGKTIITGIPRGRYIGPPYGNMYLDWESLVNEKLIDGLVIGVVSGKWLYPALKTPHAELGYLSSEDDEIDIPSLENAVKTIYGPVCSKKNVKLYFYSGAYTNAIKRFKTKEPLLTGYMIDTPSGAGRGYIQHDKSLCFPRGKMTIEAWLNVNSYKPSILNTASRILSKYNQGAHDTQRGYEWILTNEGKLQLRVNQYDPEKKASSDITLTSKSVLPLHRWVHVATVFDLPKKELRIYLDGRLDNRCPASNCPLRDNPDQDLFIGKYVGNDFGNYDGLIDELRFTAEALDFKKSPEKPYTGTEKGTIALYHFDKIEEGRIIPGLSRKNLPIHLSDSSASWLVDSKPGFGKAMNLILSK